MSQPTTDIFFSQLCSACHEAMDYFDARGLAYTSYEVKWAAGGKLAEGENEDLLRSRCGDVDFVPQIFIGGRHIGGWAALTELIEKGELEALLEA